MRSETETGGRVSIVRVIIGTLLLGILVIFAVDLVEGPFFAFSTKSWPPEIRGGRVIAGIQGPVKIADVTASTVNVAAGFLGLDSLPLVVTANTQIAVNGKLGGIADLDRGQLVRIAYEVLPDRLLAWRVEVLDGWWQSSTAPVPTAAEIDATAENEPATEVARRDDATKPAAAPIAKPDEVTPPATASEPVTSTPPSVSPVLRAAARRAPVPKPSPRIVIPHEPQPVAAPVPTPAARSSTAEDGGAAIDWLLRQSSNRSQ
jgi:hypothetical protein